MSSFKDRVKRLKEQGWDESDAIRFAALEELHRVPETKPKESPFNVVGLVLIIALGLLAIAISIQAPQSQQRCQSQRSNHETQPLAWNWRQTSSDQ